MPCLQQNNRKDVHITYRYPTDKRKLHQETCRMLCELVTNIKRKGNGGVMGIIVIVYVSSNRKKKKK